MSARVWSGRRCGGWYLERSPLRRLALVVPFGVNPQGTGLSIVIRGRPCGGSLWRDLHQSEQVASAQTTHLGPLGFTPRGAGQSEGAARAALERSNTSALTQYRLPLDHQLQRLADEIDLAFAEFG